MSSTTQTALTVAAGVAGTALVAWPLFIWVSGLGGLVWWEVRKLEKPKYTVLKTLDATSRFAPPVEVRRYDPYLVAEVTFDKETTPDMRKALSSGFRNIAQYIFDSKGEGQREDDPHREKIAMTSPVAAEMSDDGYKVSFVMPSKYTEESIPKPKNAKVEIKPIGAHTLAAISFRGKSPREKEVAARKRQLLDILKKHDITVRDGPTRVYQYHPPFAVNWQRLNEVLLPVDVPEA